MTKRPYVVPCSVFGGRSPKSGKRVGSRHRWSGEAWGEGHCVYCFQPLEKVLRREQAPSPPQTRLPEID